MDELLGGGTMAEKILSLLPLIITLIFVIISLATIPGTIGHKTKYVKKDDPEHELALKDIAIPVSLLSFTLLLLMFAMYQRTSQYKAVASSTDSL
jgi:hypothetical protein